METKLLNRRCYLASVLSGAGVAAPFAGFFWRHG